MNEGCWVRCFALCYPNQIIVFLYSFLRNVLATTSLMVAVVFFALGVTVTAGLVPQLLLVVEGGLVYASVSGVPVVAALSSGIDVAGFY